MLYFNYYAYSELYIHFTPVFKTMRPRAKIVSVANVSFIHWFYIMRTAINNNDERKQIYIKSYFCNNYH